jgi:hypothetical protein
MLSVFQLPATYSGYYLHDGTMSYLSPPEGRVILVVRKIRHSSAVSAVEITPFSMHSRIIVLSELHMQGSECGVFESVIVAVARMSFGEQ